MRSQYEIADKIIIPAIRQELIKRLREKYSLKEQEIAAKLELTQAAVSKYLNGKLGSVSPKTEEIRQELMAKEKEIDELAQSLASGKEAGRQICILCQSLGKFSCSLVKQG